MSVTIFQDENKNFVMFQTKLASQLNPILINPLNNSLVLKSIVLKNGSNVINHLLGKMQQGWFITDQNAAASIYRSAPFSTTTLTLTSNATVTVNIGVF